MKPDLTEGEGMLVQCRARLGAAVAVLLVTGCTGGALREESAGAAGSSRGSVVKIGFIAPLSGPFATLGEDMRRGFHLYLDRHEGRLGGRKVNIVEVDEGAGPETGVPAIRRLLTRDRVVAASGIVNSSVALGALQPFIDAKVPLIVANAGANVLTGAKGSEYVWRTSFANADPNRASGRWLAQQAPIPGGVFLLAPEFVAGHEQLNGFKAAFTAGGGRIAGEQYSPFGTTQDFQPYLTQVRASGAGAVYAFYSGQDAINFVRQYRDFGLAGRIPLYGPGFLTEGPVLAAQGAAADGMVNILNYSAELDTSTNRSFVEAYEGAYDARPTSFAVQAHDAAAVLDAALAEIDGAVSGPALVAALPRIGDIESPRGTWRFNATRNPQQHWYLRQVRREGDRFVNAVTADLGVLEEETKP
jgi:branched-chain amino acid transport system substrate-binding protein